MKKFLFCMALTSAVLSGATAMANGDYSSANNSVTITDAGSTTVLITKKTDTVTDSDIVYVGQDDDGFSAATFLLKENPDVGFYTITLGNQTGAAKSVAFVIGDASDVFTQAATLTELSNSEVVNADNTVTKSFVSDDIAISNIKTIVVTCDGKSAYSSVNAATELSDGGSAKIGVRISGLTKGSDVRVYISSDSVPTSGN